MTKDQKKIASPAAAPQEGAEERQEAGECAGCGGVVYHRPGRPDEYEHDCPPCVCGHQADDHELDRTGRTRLACVLVCDCMQYEATAAPPAEEPPPRARWWDSGCTCELPPADGEEAIDGNGCPMCPRCGYKLGGAPTIQPVAEEVPEGGRAPSARYVVWPITPSSPLHAAGLRFAVADEEARRDCAATTQQDAADRIAAALNAASSPPPPAPEPGGTEERYYVENYGAIDAHAYEVRDGAECWQVCRCHGKADADEISELLNAARRREGEPHAGAAHVVAKSREGGGRDEPPHYYLVGPRRETREEALADLARWEALEAQRRVEGWLAEAPAPAAPDDNELPGMWSHADLVGGWTDAEAPPPPAAEGRPARVPVSAIPRRPAGMTNAEWDSARRALPEYRMSDEEFHVLRLVAGGQISAAKARELIEDLRHGEMVDLPAYEAARGDAGEPVAPPKGESPFRFEVVGGDHIIGKVVAWDGTPLGPATRLRTHAEVEVDNLNRLFSAWAARSAPAAPAPAAPLIQPRYDRETLCPECGIGVSVDEDGSCVQCGATATGSAVPCIVGSMRALELYRKAEARAEPVAWRYLGPSGKWVLTTDPDEGRYNEERHPVYAAPPPADRELRKAAREGYAVYLDLRRLALALRDQKVTPLGAAETVTVCAKALREASGNLRAALDRSPALPALPALDEEVREALSFLRRMGQEIATQDGMGTPEGPTHATGWPVYQVEQEERVFGIDTGLMDPAGTEEDDDGGEPRPYVTRWRLVQGAVSLTRSGIEDYLRVNGHNLHRPRIFIGSMNRVAAMQGLIKALRSLAASEAVAALERKAGEAKP